MADSLQLETPTIETLQMSDKSDDQSLAHPPPPSPVSESEQDKPFFIPAPVREQNEEKTAPESSEKSDLLKEMDKMAMEQKDLITDEASVLKSAKTEEKGKKMVNRVKLILEGIIQTLRPAPPKVEKEHPDYARQSYVNVVTALIHTRDMMSLLIREKVVGVALLKEYLHLTGKPFRPPFLTQEELKTDNTREHPIGKFNAKWLIKLDEYLLPQAAEQIIEELMKRAAIPLTTVPEVFAPAFFRVKFDHIVVHILKMLVTSKDLELREGPSFAPLTDEISTEAFVELALKSERSILQEEISSDEKTKKISELDPELQRAIIFSNEIRSVFQTVMSKLYVNALCSPAELIAVKEEFVSISAALIFLFCQRERDFTKAHLANVCSACKDNSAYPLNCTHCKEPVRIKLSEGVFGWLGDSLFPQLQALEKGHRGFATIRAKKDFEDIVWLSMQLIMNYTCHSHMGKFFPLRRAFLCALVYEQNTKLGYIAQVMYGKEEAIADDKTRVTDEEYALFGNSVNRAALKNLSSIWHKRILFNIAWNAMSLRERLFVVLTATPADVLRLCAYTDFDIDEGVKVTQTQPAEEKV